MRPSRHQATQSQHGALVDIEIGVNRIHRHDRREHGFVGPDQVARIDHAAADAAVDRRGDARIAQIQIGQFLGGLQAFERRLRLGVVERVLIELFLRLT